MLFRSKSSETDESSDDEDSKMKSYITRKFKKFMKNANGRNFDKDHKQSSSSQFKGQDKGKKDTKGRRMLRKVISTLFSQDLSVLGVKASGT